MKHHRLIPPQQNKKNPNILVFISSDEDGNIDSCVSIIVKPTSLLDDIIINSSPAKSQQSFQEMLKTQPKTSLAIEHHQAIPSLSKRKTKKLSLEIH
jgi:hypothetical protein